MTGLTRVFLACVVAILVAACNRNQTGFLVAEERGDLRHAPAPRAWFDQAITEACGDVAIRPGVFVRQPYLQQTTSTSTLVRWVATADTGAELRLRRPGDADVIAASATVEPVPELPRGRQFVAAASGLEPATLYCYEIAAGDEILASGLGVRTAAEPGAPRVSFAVVGDVGYRSVDQAAVLGQLRTVPLEFLIITGDVAYEEGELAELEHNFFAPYADILRVVPVFPAPGNHDYLTRGAEPFRQAFAGGGELYGSIEWGDVYMAILDTQQLDAEQLDWLDAELAQTTATFKLIAGHEPPFSSGQHGGNDDVRSKLVPLLERHGIELAFFGHEHSYERTREIDGVTYIVTGGGGRGTRPIGESEFTAFSAQVAHFVYVVVEGDVLTAYAIDGVGRELDTVSIRAESP